MILVVLLYALFASVFTVGKEALEVSTPLFIVGTRMTFAGVLMLSYLLLFKREKLVLSGVNWMRLCLLGVINIYLVNALEFWGLKYLTSFKTCFIYSLSPFVSAILSYLIFSERLTKGKWIGLTIGFLGFIPILTHSTEIENAVGQLWIFSWPELFVVGAAILSCWGWILLRQLVREGGCSSLMANGASMLIGGLIALGHSALVDDWNPVPVTEMAPFLETALLMLLLSNLLAYNLYGYLLKRFTATFISFAGFTTPIFSAIFGWLLLDETINLPFILSTAIVFVGLLFFYLEELKTGYTVQTSNLPKTATKAL